MFGAVALIDKPLDLTSFGVVARMRRLFRDQVGTRVGHTGTLDPLATGLLPICLGEATKFAQRMLDADKGYLATVKLGAATTTADREGEITETGPSDFSVEQISAVFSDFLGGIIQKPPIFSALKINGRPAYSLAREGKAVDLPERTVQIHSLKLLAHRPEAQEFDIEVRCSKGTYIRSLAVDLGAALSTVAHLSALRRTGTGGFDLRDAKPLDAWMEAAAEERHSWLLPVDSLVADLPRLELDQNATTAIKQGKVITDLIPESASASYRLYGPGNAFLGLGEPDPRTAGALRAQRLMSTAD